MPGIATVIKKPESEASLFSVGEVTKFMPHLGTGFIKIKNGEEVYFSMSSIEVLPEKTDSKISTGIKVGYDVAMTSNGLRISKIRIF